MIATNPDWQKAREDIGNVELVLKLVRGGRPTTRSSRGLRYHFDRGDRRGRSQGSVNRISGERVHERDLLGQNLLLLDQSLRETHVITVIGTALQLGARQKQKREVDLWGVDHEGAPVAIEIKDTANDPWYAAVELCEYVWRMKSDATGLESSLQKFLGRQSRLRGAWGLLLGPRKWWERESHAYAVEQHRILLRSLKERGTKVRICSSILPPAGSQNLMPLGGAAPTKKKPSRDDFTGRKWL